MAPLAKPLDAVYHSVPHLEDFALVERCLSGESDALQALQAEYGPDVLRFLMRSGTDIAQAEEIVTQMWADLAVAPPGESPRLSRYDGSCRLATWLNTVAMNRLLTARRSQRRRESYIGVSIDAQLGDEEGTGTLESLLSAPSSEFLDPPLVELLRGAIQAAFAACSAETFVLLQLAHGDGLRLRELGQIWGCNPATISRRLERDTAEIARAVLDHIRSTDPLLELTWSDFVQLCQTANLGALGFE